MRLDMINKNYQNHVAAYCILMVVYKVEEVLNVIKNIYLTIQLMKEKIMGIKCSKIYLKDWMYLKIKIINVSVKS